MPREHWSKVEEKETNLFVIIVRAPVISVGVTQQNQEGIFSPQL